MKCHWFLPTASDGRSLTVGTHGTHGHLETSDETCGCGADRFRAPTLNYLSQIAKAAELLGFDGILTPTGTFCEDAWLISAALCCETERLKFLVAFRSGFISPTLAAQMAATYQRISRGRLLLNVVTGGEREEQARFGDYLPKNERYLRAAEFLTIMRSAWEITPFDFQGEYYKVSGATVSEPPDPVPLIYFGGSSPEAGAVAAKNADIYLSWGEPPAVMAPRLARVRELAEKADRRLQFGIRFHVVTRDSAAEAWFAAERLLNRLDPGHVAQVQQILAASESNGQTRMRSLHAAFRVGWNTRDLEIYPNLWAGVGLLRGGAGTALVGSHKDVADRIEEYAQLGIEEFILSGFPHLEEAYWVGEGVLPELRRRGLLASPDACSH